MSDGVNEEFDATPGVEQGADESQTDSGTDAGDDQADDGASRNQRQAQSVPYERFQEVNSRMREMEIQNQTLMRMMQDIQSTSRGNVQNEVDPLDELDVEDNVKKAIKKSLESRERKLTQTINGLQGRLIAQDFYMRNPDYLKHSKEIDSYCQEQYSRGFVVPLETAAEVITARKRAAAPAKGRAAVEHAYDETPVARKPAPPKRPPVTHGGVAPAPKKTKDQEYWDSLDNTVL